MTLVHEDDFLVSAIRHRQEHEHLLRKRLYKEGVRSESQLKVPARFVLLRRGQGELKMDPLNPHLLLMATSSEGNIMARQVTAAMTRFVNETAYRAIKAGQVRPLDSVARWIARNPKKTTRARRKKSAQGA
jgi:hypothetical protein